LPCSLSVWRQRAQTASGGLGTLGVFTKYSTDIDAPNQVGVAGSTTGGVTCTA
jgi:hypothetical protein